MLNNSMNYIYKDNENYVKHHIIFLEYINIFNILFIWES